MQSSGVSWPERRMVRIVNQLETIHLGLSGEHRMRIAAVKIGPHGATKKIDSSEKLVGGFRFGQLAK
jgi:hypothetical protein